MFGCNFCDLFFNTECGRDHHTAEVHGATGTSIFNQSGVMCSCCKTQYESLIKHLDVYNYNNSISHIETSALKTEKTFSCAYCQGTFTSKKSRKKHVAAKHNDLKISTNINQHTLTKHTTQQKCFICNVCSKQFNDKLALEQHKSTKHRTLQPLQPHEKIVPAYKENIPLTLANLLPSTDCAKKNAEQKINNTENKHLLDKNRAYLTQLSCTHCSKTFQTEIQLQQHRESKHELHQSRHPVTPLPPKNGTKAVVQPHQNEIVHKINSCVCIFCLKIFKATEHLEQHKLAKHGLHINQLYQTKMPQKIKNNFNNCSKTVNTVKALEQHTLVQQDFPQKNPLSLTTDQETQLHKIFSCKYCKKTVKDMVGLSSHINSVHGYVHCDICNTMFMKTQDFVNHLKEVHNIFRCFICNKSFKSTAAIKQHMESTHEYTIFPCELCFEYLQSQLQLNEHVQAVHNVHFSCNDCTKSFKKLKDLEQHQLDIHTKLVPTTINQFSNLAELNTHIRFPHEIPKLPLKSENNLKSKNCVNSLELFNTEKSKLNICNYCNKKLESEHDLRKHEEVHKFVDYFACQNCDQVFFSEAKMKIHIGSVHRSMCGYCLKQFGTKDELQKHKEMTHLNKNYFPCEICSDIFTSNISKKHHMDVAHEIICNYCSKTFKVVTQMKQHEENVHKNVDFFSCDYCSKIFTTESHLKQHEGVVHVDIDYFPCLYCTEILLSNISRINHIDAVHKVTCSYCLKKFKDATLLKNHEDNKHKNIDYFQCDLCYQVFSSNRLRNNHIEVVHKVKCCYCFKTFNGTDDLKQHEEENHKNVDFFPCEFCSEVFVSNIIRNNHIDSTHKVKCYYCLKTFTEIDHLKQHEQDKHKNVDFFPCHSCLQIFSTDKLRETHTLAHHPINKLKCNYCAKEFAEFNFLKLHEQQHKNIDYFPCDNCCEIFSSNISRRKHYLLEHNKKQMPSHGDELQKQLEHTKKILQQLSVMK